MFIYPSDLHWPLTNPVFKFYQRFFSNHIHNHKHTYSLRLEPPSFSLCRNSNYLIGTRSTTGKTSITRRKCGRARFQLIPLPPRTVSISCLIKVPLMTYAVVSLPLRHCLYVCLSPSHSLMPPRREYATSAPVDGQQPLAFFHTMKRSRFSLTIPRHNKI